MRIALLSPYPERILSAASILDTVIVNPPGLTPDKIDFIISFGHRSIIPAETLEPYGERAINIHISLLPWNKGADPNFCSWYDNTPKGVSIHVLSKGLDTGDLLFQRKMEWTDPNATLRTTYADLMNEADKLFASAWPILRKGEGPRFMQPKGGSYHRSTDKADIWATLPLGFDTTVLEISRLKH